MFEGLGLDWSGKGEGRMRVIEDECQISQAPCYGALYVQDSMIQCYTFPP